MATSSCPTRRQEHYGSSLVGLGQAFLDYFRSVDASDTLACSVALRSATRVIIEDVNADPAYLPSQAHSCLDRISCRAVDTFCSTAGRANPSAYCPHTS